MHDIVSQEIINILKQKNKDKEGTIYCIQHQHYLKQYIDRNYQRRKARAISSSRKHHLSNTHTGGIVNNVSDLRIKKDSNSILQGD